MCQRQGGRQPFAIRVVHAGKGWRAEALQHSGWWKALRKLGVVDEASHSHDARHEHVSAAIENGIPADEIRLVTGHKSVQAFERYNHAKGGCGEKLGLVNIRLA